MKVITNGICAAKGFKGAGIHCGIRKNRSKKDLALIFSEKKASAACVYTTNLVKGAPIYVTQRNVADGFAQAIICNSGNANTCNANGQEIAQKMCDLVANELKINASDVIVASTGVIGEPLNIKAIEDNIDILVASLGNDSSSVAHAIMTTDLVEKEIAVSFEISGVECRLGGVAKGSGMINPNMATMLVFLTTDVSIEKSLLQKALLDATNDTFNMVSVDGDTSTNDMVSILANGMANNKTITKIDADYQTFYNALVYVMKHLSKAIAQDGEGATKLLECNVVGAPTKEAARIIAKKVISSCLVKAAMFGSDANWGRVLCAIGYSGVDVKINLIDVKFESEKGEILVCQNGAGVRFDEENAKSILKEKYVKINISLNQGNFNATAWGCDLTYDYVKINGDYRS
ncbi:MAG: bifunctional ornithine acetyltransferase/N-acetylglutamate synthase [Bacilli bacterium]|jgi:glutamate N-acetyltransferase/amino-acid N-acetyltransferase